MVEKGSVHLGSISGEGLLTSQKVILVWCSRSLNLGSISGVGPPHFAIRYTGLVYYVTVHLGSISSGEPPHFLPGYTGLV